MKGFTLLELMVVLSVVAILAAVAVPSFDILIKNNRLRSQASSLHLALMMARSEALGRIERVTVCKSSDGATCTTSGGWEQGWIVFHDPANPVVVDTGEQILRVDDALTGGTTLRGSSAVSAYISYVGTGATQTASGGNQRGTLALCDDRGFVSNARAIDVEATGRARILEATASSLTSCTPS